MFTLTTYKDWYNYFITRGFTATGASRLAAKLTGAVTNA